MIATIKRGGLRRTPQRCRVKKWPTEFYAGEPLERNVQIESIGALAFLIGHDFFGRPFSTFPDHALVTNGRLELLLFCGVALHVNIFAVPRLTSHLASVAPRLTSRVATSAPRLTPVHTGR
jgi:hypothetical protein